MLKPKGAHPLVCLYGNKYSLCLYALVLEDLDYLRGESGVDCNEKASISV